MFKSFVCWDKADATKILTPLALEGGESVFVATHSPIFGLAITGTEAHTVAAPTEVGVLEALSSPERRHAVCVVEGEAGSGKSHLIRWLKVNWPGGNDLVVLIERADGTLDGTLRQLKEKLSKESAASLDSIVPQRQLTDQGQREALLALLASLSRSGNLKEPLGDEEWCDKHGISDVLQSSAVRLNWEAPERVRRVLTGKADRDSRIARFTVNDVLDLNHHLAGLRGRDAGPGAIRLAQKLREEGQAARSALETCSSGQDEPDLSMVAPTTAKFLAALNNRLNVAIQQAMGISGDALQKMFRDLRRRLLAENRRLVLLLEDLTSAQGVDQELLYVLQEKSTTQEEFCDIVSVIGVTPSYYRQYVEPQANVVQRITHQIRFGENSGSFQAVSALHEESEQVAFASRYLRAIRAGVKEVDLAFSEGRPVTNRCPACPHIKDCHDAFGDVDGVGLYPLTAKAIGRMFSSLTDPKGTMFLQTPRALIQAILSPSIASVTQIEQGVFPGAAIETEWHPESKRQVQGLAQKVIDKSAEEDRERLRITVSWWGDGQLPHAGDALGAWGGVPGGVFQAFSLPKPESESAPAVGPESGKSIPQTLGTSKDSGGVTRAGLAPSGGSNIGVDGVGGGVRQSRAPRLPPQRPLDNQLQRISAWGKSKKIEDDGFWWGRAKKFIDALAWKGEDIPHWFVHEALGEVRLEGSGKTDERNLVVPCEPWAASGLEWLARLEDGHLAPGEAEVGVRAVTLFAHKMRRTVIAWVAARAPSAQGGGAWNFGATMAQVLLVRAYLRGETRPGAPLAEQWQLILSDDSPGGAIGRPGATKWGQAIENLAGDWTLHRRIREFANCEGLADVSAIAPAIYSLAIEGKLADFPESPPTQPSKTKWLESLVSSAKHAESALNDVPEWEVKRLRGRVTQVLEIAGSENFSAYVIRAKLAFERVRKDLPTLAPDELAQWAKTFESKKTLFENTGPGTEHDSLRRFVAANLLDSPPQDAPLPNLLDYAIDSPAESLENVHDVLKKTEVLVKTLVDYLEPFETTSDTASGADAIVNFGKRVSDLAGELKEVSP